MTSKQRSWVVAGVVVAGVFIWWRVARTRADAARAEADRLNMIAAEAARMQYVPSGVPSTRARQGIIG